MTSARTAHLGPSPSLTASDPVPPDSGAGPAALLVGGGLALGWVLPELVNVGLPVAALALSLVLLARGRVVAVWELALWLYLLLPVVRRVVDWRSSFHEDSPILLAAPAVGLLGLLALQRTRPLPAITLTAFVVTLLASTYATLLGFHLRDPTPVAVAVAQWVSPLALALLVLVGPADQDQVRAALRRLTRWGLLILGAYGLVQYFVLPPWDAAWMTSVRDVLGTIGVAEPRQVRVFSTGNAPGPMAAVLGVLVLLALGAKRTRLDDLGLALGLATLGLSLVRASWLAVAVAVVLLALSRRVSLVRVLGSVTAVVLLVLLVGGPVAETITDRIDQTTGAGREDVSFQARLDFQAAVLPVLLSDVFGAGFGSTGTASRRGSGDTSFADTDSGYVETLRIFGAPLALLVLLSVLGAVVAAWLAALRSRAEHSAERVVLAATLVTVPVALLFSAALTAASGAFFWSLLALAARADGTDPDD